MDQIEAITPPEPDTLDGLNHRARHDGPQYRAPTDLQHNPTRLRRVLLVGACILDAWKSPIEALPDGCACERVLFNNLTTLPPQPELPLSEYDLQIVSIPFRSVVPENSAMRLPYTNATAWEQLFDECCGRLGLLLEGAMRWNVEGGMLTFVSNFLLPQQNAMGRLMPRYDLRNPVHFTERLNQHLVELLGQYSNTHLLDADGIAATFGRKYIQDDSVCVSSHNSLLNDWDHPLDQARIHKPEPLSRLYSLRTDEFIRAIWAELVASFRTVRQVDGVKMVVMDLDDTMWRGVIAESESITGLEFEGWPLGVTEALVFLKRRGVMLAIVSKNEEEVIRRVWPQAMGGRLELDDFAFVRINWKTKAENIREIVAAANILPTSVVFVDDNPVERAAVTAELPGVRAIGADPYYTRRILLWSPEAQVAVVTDESSRRTEMIQQQVKREGARKTMSRAEFLAGLNVRVRLVEIDGPQHPNFPRVLELINKTNQFNTNGRRWTQEALVSAIGDGTHRVWAFFVRDVYTEYGLVGVIVFGHDEIEQFVMSCRVLGMDVEVAVLQHLAARRSAVLEAPLTATIVETPANMPCRDLYARSGFSHEGGLWVRRREDAPVEVPHVAFED